MYNACIHHMCICHIYVYMYMWLHVDTCTHAYMCNSHVHLHAYVRTCIRMGNTHCVYIYIYIYAQYIQYIYIYIYMYMCMYAHIYVYMYVYMCIYIHYVYIYIYIHTHHMYTNIYTCTSETSSTHKVSLLPDEEADLIAEVVKESGHHLYGDLTMTSPNYDFNKSLKFTHLARVLLNIQGCFCESIVGEIIVRSPYRSPLRGPAPCWSRCPWSYARVFARARKSRVLNMYYVYAHPHVLDIHTSTTYVCMRIYISMHTG